MFVLVLLAVVAQGYAQQSSSVVINKCPNLIPDTRYGTAMPRAIQYQTFVSNNSDNQNIDTVCYRHSYNLLATNVSDIFQIVVAARINTTGGVERKVSFLTQPTAGVGILSPGFGSIGGVFTETVVNFSGCNSKLAFSCSTVGESPSYAVATTATRGQKFTAECTAKAIQVLTQRGLQQSGGYIALPMNYLSLCDSILQY